VSFLKDSILTFVSDHPGCFAWEIIQHIDRTKKGVDALKVRNIITGMVGKELETEVYTDRRGEILRYWRTSP
jgi:hypothetical protein